MNWKPKNEVTKTLYTIDICNLNFNGSTTYEIWTSGSYCPTIVKYTDVMIITNGLTKSTTFIIAKRTKKNIKDEEYKTYRLKRINSIDEDKQGVVLMRGYDIFISNDKKKLLNILISLYKKKEIAARKAIDDYDAGKYDDSYNKDWIKQRLMEQPKYVMESYKNFVKNLKKI